MQLKKVPDYKGSTFNPEVLPNEDHEPTAERAELHEEYAHLWNNVSHATLFPQNMTFVSDLMILRQLYSIYLYLQLHSTYSHHLDSSALCIHKMT